MLWTACLSSERFSHSGISLHAPGSTCLRIHIINRCLVALLGTTSALEASGCEKGATARNSAWLTRVKRLSYLHCSVEVLRDWRAMVGALTDDRANEARGDAATTNLVLLLSASVHRAVSAAPAGHRTDAK